MAMTFKQRLVKFLYPLIMRSQKSKSSQQTLAAAAYTPPPPVSFYSLQVQGNNGKPFSLEACKGKYVLIVNTASECGYTPQYTALEALHQQYPGKLAVIGFPANDFGGQEPGSDESIASFCQVNFGVSFPLMQKGAVSGSQLQPVYQWLTQPAQNGWNEQQPTWNFCKYLVSPDGKLLHFFPSGVDPLDPTITNYLS
ncbi:MAG TPA: glutathione peroxidase [Phnomibacter sp.]|nr:glutathione peroxidase [Phnomibacter sp.]